jgi:hypothetical protein
VVVVVVDPVVEQVLDAQLPDLLVDAVLAKVGVHQALHERKTVSPHLREGCDELAQRAPVVLAILLHLDLVPGVLGQAGLGQDAPDTAREAPGLGLDQVPEALLDAPLALSRVPGGDVLGELTELGPDRLANRPEEARDLLRRQRPPMILDDQAGACAAVAPSLSPAPTFFLISSFMILPVGPLGSSGQTWMVRGYL